MSNPTVTYQFTNGQTSDASAVNQNFTDLINAMTDGSKDFTLGVLTANGDATLKGNVTVGTSSSDLALIKATLALRDTSAAHNVKLVATSSTPLTADKTITIDVNNSNLSLSGSNTGDQTITLTGQATGAGTGSFAVTLTNSSVIGQTLTSYSAGAGTVSATDTIIGGVQKVDGNHSALSTTVTSLRSAIASYWSGSLNAPNWTITGNTYIDFSPSGSASATTLASYGTPTMTITAAAGNKLGIAFTPAASTAVYAITARFSAFNTGTNNNNSLRMTDGTTVWTRTSFFNTAATTPNVPITLTALVYPATTTSYTLKIQGATLGSTLQIDNEGVAALADPVSEWSVVRVGSN